MAFRSLVNFTFPSRYLILVAAGLFPFVALSEDVVLKSADGSINLTGELIDFSDDDFVIKTVIGEFSISAAEVSCEGEACPNLNIIEADVAFAGSDTIGLGMMPLLLSGYASLLGAKASDKTTENENEILTDFVADGGYGDELASYLVTSTTSSDAFSSLLGKSAVIGMASRRIQPDEARELSADGAGKMVLPQQEHLIAVDSLIVITHPENEVTSITLDQLRGIYAGAITNWSELGGVDVPVNVIDRQESSGTRNVFMNTLFGEGGETAKPTEYIAGDNNDMAAMVYADPNAIGFVGYAFQRGTSALKLVNECGIPTTPDAFSAKTEEYPLQRRLYLYNRSDNVTDASADFIKYATSSDADGVIAKSGFIDLSVKIRDMDMNGSRARQLLEPDADPYESSIMREMLRQMLEFDRLSTTFRFAPGSFTMDERAAVDMARLATYLETKPAGTTVMFSGFTDSAGAFDSNRTLSLNRAKFAAKTFGEYAGDRIDHIEFASAGFGELAPVACNTDVGGRAINRRVELWIKQP